MPPGGWLGVESVTPSALELRGRQAIEEISVRTLQAIEGVETVSVPTPSTLTF